MVYKLVQQYKLIGEKAYEHKKRGRPKNHVNPKFVDKIVEIRKKDDYGSVKIHYLMNQAGYGVSQRQIQRILDEKGLTDFCVKRRGQRKYVRYQWPLSNYMWHCDWTFYDGEWYIAFLDDRSRKIMAAAKFKEATTQNALFVLFQAILVHGVCPVVILSDKGSQFYANKATKEGERAISSFERELKAYGIELWTSRRNHPQTNGKMEKWFDTMKKRLKRHPEESLQDLVTWYNEHRIHDALDNKTPDEVYNKKL